jgi:hypothetical protein
VALRVNKARGEGDRVGRFAAVQVADELPVHRVHHPWTRPLGVRLAARVHLPKQSAARSLAGFPLELQLS